ncbi:Rad52/Rad22 family DNA repair protein [Paludisphaera mucosa]|uniref:Rad52/Rad22 family DNA repair protein n=1 Tax=Paludisphaera mucosa TaxID=3030827 RepID=A0ABT6F991_9BACT|nr:Rad52/Rad22 family DNA repair protein [Paludisphaera mucosa]MDG3004155.1 Rad52/Rad22 family DNA repair protein [Paludisphaera mucosa]
MSQHIEIFAALAAPFANDEVRSRSQGGRDFQYVTARTVMNRLDEVLGPENWWDEYTPMENAVICKLSIRLPDGTALTKSDAGGFTTTADTSDYEKSGFSDAFKRAAVKFGVARYLYGDGVPQSIRDALIRSRREQQQAAREQQQQHQAAAPAPVAAAPTVAEAVEARAAESLQPLRQAPEVSVGGTPPKSGKALFAWIKERDEKLGVDLLKTLSDWGKNNHFPARMVQWSGEQVDQGHSEALRVLTTMRSESPAMAGASQRR